MTSETTTTFQSERAPTDTLGRAEASLQQLLDQDPSDVRRKLRDQFAETAGDSTKLIILFGVKSWPAKHALEGLKRLGLEPRAFTDNDSSLWNTEVDGIRVLSPKEAANSYRENGVFVVSIYNGSAPRNKNFQKSEAFVATLPTSLQQRIVLRKGAVGAKTQDVRFDFTGSAASTVLATNNQEQREGAHPKTMPFTASEGVIDVKSFALDDVLAPGSQYYVKMDIEGAEFDALLGAERLLRERKSVWAVCLYHRLSDLWRIPLLFAKIGGYRLYLRRYAEGFVETVCYAVPSDRMNS